MSNDIEDRLLAVIHGDGLDEAEEMALLRDALGTIRRRQDIKDQTEWDSEVINAVVEHVGGDPRDYEDGVTASDIQQALSDHNDEFERESERLQTARAGLARLQALNAQMLEALGRLTEAYRNTLRLGYERITDLGGSCDAPEVMEAGDPELRKARAVLAAARGVCKDSLRVQGRPTVKESLTVAHVEGSESHG